MRSVLLVSRDSQWLASAESALLMKDWDAVIVDGVGVEKGITASKVKAVILDTSSLTTAEVGAWLAAGAVGEGVEVVLAPGGHSAFPLGKFQQNEETQFSPDHFGIKVRFWGVRGSIPSPGPHTAYYGGNTSCVELQADGETMILDAGSGLRPLGERLIQEANGAPLSIHLLISHTHWDHIQGFPFFRPAYQPANRLRLIGYSGVRHDLEELLHRQMDQMYFPIAMSDMLSEIDVMQVGEVFHCGPVKGHAFYTNHPGKCAGFRFDTGAGAVVYVPDNEINQSGQATHMPRETAKHLRARFVETVSGARVLIHDAQYTRAEYVDRVGWGHSCIEDVVEMAGEAGVERLYLFHHDPTRTDRNLSELVKMARKLAKDKGWDMSVDAAREGDEIIL